MRNRVLKWRVRKKVEVSILEKDRNRFLKWRVRKKLGETEIPDGRYSDRNAKCVRGSKCTKEKLVDLAKSDEIGRVESTVESYWNRCKVTYYYYLLERMKEKFQVSKRVSNYILRSTIMF